MQKKQYKRFFGIVFLMIFFLPAWASASESLSDYHSIHQETVAVTYTQYNTDATTGVITTTNEIKQYSSFLNLYNLNDTIIACGTQNDPSGCTITDEKTWLPTIVWGAAGTNPALSSNTRFKVFVPPGALQISLRIFIPVVPQISSFIYSNNYQPLIKAVVRFDQVPDCVDCTSSQAMFTQESTFFFEKFETEDVHLQNTGEQIAIYQKSLQRAPDAFSPAPAITQGGWLYVYVYDQANAVGMIQYDVKVDRALYTEWYDNYDRTNDIYGLASGSPTISITPIITINTDLSFSIPDALYQSPTGNSNLWLDFEFFANPSGKLLWELVDFGNATPTGNHIDLSPNISFSIPDATYQSIIGDINLETNFTFFENQNGKLLWELDSYDVN